MGDVIVGIHQPNFMPWLGYFYKILQSDKFIFLDDVQFPKTGSSYVNRVSVNIAGKSQYITAPVKRRSGTWKINETEFNDQKWKKKIIGTLQGNYAKAPFFKQYKYFIFSLIEYEVESLASYNINFITKVCCELDINTQIIKSSDLNINTTSTQRLVDLIKCVDGNIYLSGSGGDNYQDHEMFKKENIVLKYNKFPLFTYSQVLTKEFISGLSIVDAIFNIGFKNIKNNIFR